MYEDSEKQTSDDQDEKAVMALSDEEEAILDRVREKICSGQVLFKEGSPVEMEDKPVGFSAAKFIDICQSNDYLGALQVVNNAASGKFWGKASDTNLSVALSQIEALEPETPLEAMLVSQMVAVNTSIGKLMSRAMHQEQSMKGREVNANLATKFQRTFLKQIDALQKLQKKGQQTVRVEHVTVNSGGQAVVGNVDQKSRGGG